MLINFILFFTTHSIILVLFALRYKRIVFLRFERTIEYFCCVSVFFFVCLFCVTIRLYFKLYNIFMYVFFVFSF